MSLKLYSCLQWTPFSARLEIFFLFLFSLYLSHCYFSQSPPISQQETQFYPSERPKPHDPPGSCFPCTVCSCLVMAFLLAFFILLFSPFALISALCVQRQSFHSRVLNFILTNLTHLTCLGNSLPTTIGLIFSISSFQSSKTILNLNTRLI